MRKPANSANITASDKPKYAIWIVRGIWYWQKQMVFGSFLISAGSGSLAVTDAVSTIGCNADCGCSAVNSCVLAPQMNRLFNLATTDRSGTCVGFDAAWRSSRFALRHSLPLIAELLSSSISEMSRSQPLLPFRRWCTTWSVCFMGDVEAAAVMAAPNFACTVILSVDDDVSIGGHALSSADDDIISMSPIGTNSFHMFTISW